MLRCADGSLYVGSTRELFARLNQHELGLGAAYTRDRRPVELVWHEEHEHVGSAFSREKQIQNWSRAKRLALIAGDYEGLPELSKKNFSRAPGAVGRVSIAALGTRDLLDHQLGSSSRARNERGVSRPTRRPRGLDTDLVPRSYSTTGVWPARRIEAHLRRAPDAIPAGDRGEWRPWHDVRSRSPSRTTSRSTSSTPTSATRCRRRSWSTPTPSSTPGRCPTRATASSRCSAASSTRWTTCRCGPTAAT